MQWVTSLKGHNSKVVLQGFFISLCCCFCLCHCLCLYLCIFFGLLGQEYKGGTWFVIWSIIFSNSSFQTSIISQAIEVKGKVVWSRSYSALWLLYNSYATLPHRIVKKNVFWTNPCCSNQSNFYNYDYKIDNPYATLPNRKEKNI